MVSKKKVTNLCEIQEDIVDENLIYKPRAEPRAYNIYFKRKIEACYLIGNSNQGWKFLKKIHYLKHKVENLLLFHPITNFRLVKRVLIGLKPDHGLEKPKWLNFLHTLFRLRKSSFKKTNGLANEIC